MAYYLHHLLPLQSMGGSPTITTNFEINYPTDPVTGVPTVVGPSGVPGPKRTIVLCVRLSQEIYNTDEKLPIVGTRAVGLGQTDHPIHGFQFDRRRWVDDEIDPSRNSGFIGDIEYSIIEGTLAKHWLSGIGDRDDCEFIKLYERTPCIWLPRLNRGTYFSQYQEYYLWSEEAITHPLIEDFIHTRPQEHPDNYSTTNQIATGTGRVVLSHPAKALAPITGTIFSRGPQYQAIPYRQATQVDEFTGMWDGHEQLSPIDSAGFVNYDKVDSFARDELIYNSNIVLAESVAGFQLFTYFDVGPNPVINLHIQIGDADTVVVPINSANNTIETLSEYINDNIDNVICYLLRINPDVSPGLWKMVFESSPTTPITIHVEAADPSLPISLAGGYTFEVVDSQIIKFNNNIAFGVGDMFHWVVMNATAPGTTTTDSTALQNALYKLERLGTSNGESNQIYLTKFFPIDPKESMNGKINVYAHNTTTLTLWPVATNNALQNHSNTDRVCEVDYDYGLVRFALDAPSATSKLFPSALFPADTRVIVDDAAGFPTRGRLNIDGGAEIIQYETRDDTAFYNLTRGLTGLPPTHTAGVEVKFEQCGAYPGANEIVSAAYVTTPRIEYEPDEFKDHVTADITNVHPLANSRSTGIVYIGRTPDVLGSLVLETDLSSLGMGVYGPLAVGTAYTMLTATAFALDASPLPGVTITIDEVPASPFIGLLNGCPCPYVNISNQDGEIISNYTSGNDLDMVGEFVTTWNHIGGTEVELTIPKYLPNLTLGDTLLFAVTKDDPMHGTEGVFATALGFNNWDNDPGNPWGSKLTSGNIILDPATSFTGTNLPLKTKFPSTTFDNGTVTIVDITDQVFDVNVWGDRDGIIYIKEAVPSAFVGTIRYIQIRSPSWNEFDLTMGPGQDGRKRVIYQYDAGVINPATAGGEHQPGFPPAATPILGAYYPIIPITYTSTASPPPGVTTLTFDTQGTGLALPEPDFGANPLNNLGSYWVATDATVSFQASAIDPFTGNIMYSNTIDIQLTLPAYLKGVYLSGSGYIPYGWQIVNAAGDPSTGIGPHSSTFVTINPHAGSSAYPAITNPFGALNFTLPT